MAKKDEEVKFKTKKEVEEKGVPVAPKEPMKIKRPKEQKLEFEGVDYKPDGKKSPFAPPKGKGKGKAKTKKNEYTFESYDYKPDGKKSPFAKPGSKPDKPVKMKKYPPGQAIIIEKDGKLEFGGWKDEKAKEKAKVKQQANPELGPGKPKKPYGGKDTGFDNIKPGKKTTGGTGLTRSENKVIREAQEKDMPNVKVKEPKKKGPRMEVEPVQPEEIEARGKEETKEKTKEAPKKEKAVKKVDNKKNLTPRDKAIIKKKVKEGGLKDMTLDQLIDEYLRRKLIQRMEDEDNKDEEPKTLEGIYQKNKKEDEKDAEGEEEDETLQEKLEKQYKRNQKKLEEAKRDK